MLVTLSELVDCYGTALSLCHLLTLGVLAEGVSAVSYLVAT